MNEKTKSEGAEGAEVMWLKGPIERMTGAVQVYRTTTRESAVSPTQIFPFSPPEA